MSSIRRAFDYPNNLVISSTANWGSGRRAMPFTSVSPSDAGTTRTSNDASKSGGNFPVASEFIVSLSQVGAKHLHDPRIYEDYFAEANRRTQ